LAFVEIAAFSGAVCLPDLIVRAQRRRSERRIPNGPAAGRARIDAPSANARAERSTMRSGRHRLHGAVHADTRRDDERTSSTAPHGRRSSDNGRRRDLPPSAILDKVVNVNLRGSFNTMREAANRLREGGRIINFSSSVAGNRQPNYGVYGATKAAIETMTSISSRKSSASAESA
jgi:NAD(P)-dependent dehydrogenase (short-subunit alcohol dehydrogenase family)